MPATLTYPGVYIEEIPSGVRTITGVATSITAFVGAALRGPVDTDPESPVTINSFADFERIFGGLWSGSSLGFAVRDFFLNGGNQALIVRLFEADATAGVNSRTPITAGDFDLEAAYPGSWGGNLRATVDTNVSTAVAQNMGLTPDKLFNLTIRDVSTGRTERFNNLTAEDRPQRIDRVLQAQSKLVRWKGDWPDSVPAFPKLKAAQDAAKQLNADQAALNALPTNDQNRDNAQKTVDADKADLATKNEALIDPVSVAEQKLADAKKTNPPNSSAVTNAQNDVNTALSPLATSDGKPLNTNTFSGPGKEGAKAGLYALRKADLFNILCIPPYAGDDVDASLVAEAAAFCEEQRAMLLIDPPSAWADKDAAKAGVGDVGTTSKNAALFFPRLRMPNPLADNQVENFVPCGAVAGIFSRTDTNRGVWKAPAGLEATLVGVPALSVPLTDPENGELNPLGINCLRSMPAVGRVVWGARTLQGADILASEWKYIPIRRTALYIEESLYRGTQWVVFEPNDEPLWAQIRLNVGAFMHGLFRQGAFQGQTPKDAYFVKCDKETTPQDQVNLGIVNIIVGFAPLKPAEFVVIQIQQMAGQIET